MAKQSARSSKAKTDLGSFLNHGPGGPGVRQGTCITCRLSSRKAIEKDCREYLAARTKGATLLTFRTFALLWIKEKHGYTAQPESLRRHMENCCGTKIP